LLADALEFYSKYNLQQLDLERNPRDKELHSRFYTPARGGGQGDYRLAITEKIANVVSALTAFPQSKRAVLPIPHTARPSSTADHTETDEAKCLRELHFYLEDAEEGSGTKRLCATGFMRAQAASIFPKNIHFIGTVMQTIASQLNVPVGCYTHIVTTLVDER
jgi:thymidylate synthase